MEHKHFWIIDSKGNAHCRDCPATKQFPVDYPKIHKHEITFLKNLDISCNPESWVYAEKPAIEG